MGTFNWTAFSQRYNAELLTSDHVVGFLGMKSAIETMAQAEGYR